MKKLRDIRIKKRGDKLILRKYKSFSLIEIILAIAIFMILAVTGITTILHSFSVNKLGEEQTNADLYAQEGLEAVRSIKNQGWSNISADVQTKGLQSSNGYWEFNGTGDSKDKYTRTILISSVNRDGSGNIIESGGSVDPDTLKVTSAVSWNFSGPRNDVVTYSTYLTNFRKAISSNGDALLLYGAAGSVAQPRYRSYTNASDSFSTDNSTGSSFTDIIGGKTFKIKTSPTKQEAIAGYVNNSGVLRILCYDGTNWSSDWTVTVGGTGTNDQRFGIAYEKTSGDMLVVYSRNVGTTDEMGYRTKLGSVGCGSANWSGETTINPIRTSGIIHWIRMEGSPSSASDNIALSWADANSDLSAMIWTSSSWGTAEPSAPLETNLERVSTSQDVQSFDMAYESVTGNLMIVWGLYQASGCTAGTTIATTNCIRYARHTSSWSAVAVIPTVADPATNIDISSNPDTNELLVASLDNSQNDLSIAYWSGSAWTGKANQDTTTRAASVGSKRVATGWLINGSSTRKIVTYNDSNATNLGWVVCTTGATCTTQTDWIPTPSFANPQSWYETQMDPKNKNQLILILSDNSSDLYAKRLVMTAAPAFTWSNSDGSSALETSLGQATTCPFGFAYWRNP